jgi:hypothetical protein
MEKKTPRYLYLIVFAGLLACSPAWEQLVEDYNPPTSGCCLASSAKTLADRLQDWNQRKPDDFKSATQRLWLESR